MVLIGKLAIVCRRARADQNEIDIELFEGTLDGATVTARLPGHTPHRAGEALELWIEPGRIQLFDFEDGHSLRHAP